MCARIIVSDNPPSASFWPRAGACPWRPMAVQRARRLRHAVHQCPRGRRACCRIKRLLRAPRCTAVSSCRSVQQPRRPASRSRFGASRPQDVGLPPVLHAARRVGHGRPARTTKTACVSRRVGCASPAGLPPDVRGAPYPVPPVAPVARARRDRNGRANRGLSSTQMVPSSCSLVPRRRRAIATPAPRCLPACPDARGGRMDCRAESQ